MRKRILSASLCFAMLFGTGSSVFANPSENPNIQATTEVTTQTTAQTTTQTDTQITTATKPETKPSKKKKVTKKVKKKTKKRTARKSTGTEFQVQKSATKKIVIPVKDSVKELTTFQKKRKQLQNTLKQKQLLLKQTKQQISTIDRFVAQWQFGTMTGIALSDRLLQENKEADQSVLSLLNTLNRPVLSEQLQGYHFGLQEQNNLLMVANEGIQTIDLQELLQNQREEWVAHESKLNQSIQTIKKELLATKKTIQRIEEKKSIVFDPMNVRIKSNLTIQKAKTMLKGTALESCAPYFIECEDQYGINAVAMMAIAVHESAWGTSRRAREDNNLTGYGVYSDSAKGINANTKEKNLLMTAKLLKEQYVVKGGSYYEGTGLMDINEHYCTSSDWAINVTNHAYTLMNRL